jgi:hypothetical protein
LVNYEKEKQMTKTAVVVFSDPNSKSDEALGRLFNALFLVHDLQNKKQEVALIFQGAGVRWLGEVVKPDHPAHTLYSTVEKQTILACGGCGDVFGASKEVEASGVKISRELPIPGTTGILSLANYIVDGYQIVNF